jgi:hypothetical protein
VKHIMRFIEVFQCQTVLLKIRLAEFSFRIISKFLYFTRYSSVFPVLSYDVSVMLPSNPSSHFCLHVYFIYC